MPNMVVVVVCTLTFGKSDQWSVPSFSGRRKKKVEGSKASRYALSVVVRSLRGRRFKKTLLRWAKSHEKHGKFAKTFQKDLKFGGKLPKEKKIYYVEVVFQYSCLPSRISSFFCIHYSRNTNRAETKIVGNLSECSQEKCSERKKNPWCRRAFPVVLSALSNFEFFFCIHDSRNINRA